MQGTQGCVWQACLERLLLGTALTACSSLPRIVPDMQPAKSPPQLSNAQGPLPASRSEAILARLERSADDTNIFDHHLAREQAASSAPLMVGNHVRLLQDGPDTYRAMFAAIGRRAITSTWRPTSSKTTRSASSLPTRSSPSSAQGVQVNLIYDSVGTLGTPKEFFKRLSDGGIHVLEFNPINPATAQGGWEVNQRDHRKLLIVDGRRHSSAASTSAACIRAVRRRVGAARRRARQRQKTCPGATPTCSSNGPVVAELQKLFIDTWERQKGAPLAPRNYYPAAARAGQGGRARDRQLARGAVQPDLRDPDLGDRQRRDRDLADQCVLRARTRSCCTR